jgi:hypothetical protein
VVFWLDYVTGCGPGRLRRVRRPYTCHGSCDCGDGNSDARIRSGARGDFFNVSDSRAGVGAEPT